ncbi:CLUMA_CG010964, isoform A [Clunio marinus]|uniref:CLUMA_CG010964, isoform A n=1 Tax=Clunio marinus TaxID=568069 RepID=A0A1J1ICV3_9DIPT|nr:CLUMA_CG010964, isoform A [Clunio marinus]
MVFDTKYFIQKILQYPEIYDPNNAGFKHVDDKNGAWEKIAKELNVDSTFCRKKFRTLRERYTRELRKSYLEPSTPIKYEYFKELSFLSPHIKFRSIKFENTEGKTIVVTKREEVDKETTDEDMKLIDQEEYFTEDQEPVYQEGGNGQNIIYETTTVQHVPEFSGNAHQIHEVVHQSDEEQHLSPSKNKDRKRKLSWDEVDQNDDNKYFAMSVACSLKRLSTLNNLKAKVEIYQVLEKFATKEQCVK